MTTEPFPIMAPIAFAITGLLAVSVIIRANIPAARAAKRLKAALAQDGKDSAFTDGLAFRKQLTLHPASIREESDSREVREAKDDLIACFSKLAPTLMRAMLIAVFGTVASAALGILEFYIRR